jgi:hypothetical protein
MGNRSPKLTNQGYERYARMQGIGSCHAQILFRKSKAGYMIYEALRELVISFAALIESQIYLYGL